MHVARVGPTLVGEDHVRDDLLADLLLRDAGRADARVQEPGGRLGERIPHLLGGQLLLRDALVPELLVDVLARDLRHGRTSRARDLLRDLQGDPLRICRVR